MRELEVYLNSQKIGILRYLRGNRVAIEYAANAPHPISLSLPLMGKIHRDAPARYLDNLLPDDLEARSWMAGQIDAKNTSIFSILEKAGIDVIGGLVMVPPGTNFPPEQLIPASDVAIAAHIRSLKRHGFTWTEEHIRPRFSLPGAQPKFTLTKIGEDFYWSNASSPSTHILKPEGRYKGAEVVELASMQLASAVGLEVPEVSRMTKKGETAYLIKRFDRVTDGNGNTHRIHMEDMVQALGKKPGFKYHASLEEITKLLKNSDATERAPFDFLKQVAYNAAIANNDAHAKNYSIFHKEDGISITPLYDSIATAYWKEFSIGLDMPFDRDKRITSTALSSWTWLANTVGLEPDRVAGTVEEIFTKVKELAPEYFKDIPEPGRSRILASIENAREQTFRATSGVIPLSPGTTVTPTKVVSPATSTSAGIVSSGSSAIVASSSSKSGTAICRGCGRPISSAKSVARGYGDECYKNFLQDMN